MINININININSNSCYAHDYAQCSPLICIEWHLAFLFSARNESFVFETWSVSIGLRWSRSASHSHQARKL